MRVLSLRASAFKGVSLTAPQPVLRHRARRSLCVENKTLWSLQVDQAWCDLNKEKCDNLEPSLDLSDVISNKLRCLVGETKNCDFTVSCGKTGVEVKIESVGTANPLDSPAELYLTDVGGTTPLMVDDKSVKHDEKVRLYPGSTIQFGDFARFQVLRNVFAHA